MLALYAGAFVRYFLPSLPLLPRLGHDYIVPRRILHILSHW